MEPISLEKKRKRRIIISLLIINFILIELAAEFGLFKGNLKYATGPISILISSAVVLLSIKYKLASWKLFIVYGIIAIAFLMLQFI
jgi:hypothetical protein